MYGYFGMSLKETYLLINGSRNKDGMNIIQAFIWNWRTYDFDVKGKITSKDFVRMKVLMQNIGAEQLVVVKKLLQWKWSKEAVLFCLIF
ncbi:hypothetical protein [Clostridium tyrobutyricum]|jgi:threonyl-tRNA synthetase|uniref:hypothetical protein n=2 Tax=Clostridium tyrobutyricum TaxID=1519 RepID=UPI000A57E248|nr:hypothetical protein [Clostridium tyrobutyricum]MBV4435695.1 hypothetical protein [Clostridium tyrobutyricum]